MQTIERYGVVALIFLIVTVLAVILWDGEPTGEATARAAEHPAPARRSIRAEPAAVSRAESPQASTDPSTGQSSDPSSAPGPRVELRLKPVPRPLSREQAEEPEAPPAGLRVARETTAGDRDLPRRAAAPPPDEPVQERPAVERRREEAPRERIYVVRASDTLSEISQAELGTSKRWREILLLNPGLDPARLAVGQKIRLPSGESVPGASVAPVAEGGTDATATAKTGATAPAARPAPANVAAGPTHRVRPGESLWKIAAQRLGDGERWREIARLNPTLDPNHLIVGREIVLPSGAAARTAPLVASNTGTQTRGRVR